jgi:hypothetical protein
MINLTGVKEITIKIHEEGTILGERDQIFKEGGNFDPKIDSSQQRVITEESITRFF